jgi:hypothetical protein
MIGSPQTPEVVMQPRIVIYVEGGRVTNVTSNIPAATSPQVVVVDGDTGGGSRCTQFTGDGDRPISVELIKLESEQTSPAVDRELDKLIDEIVQRNIDGGLQ